MTAEAVSNRTQSFMNNVPKEDRPVVCVFCGSSPGSSPSHLAAARSLAHTFHAHNIKLIFGGGTKGIMGEVARTLVSLAGHSAVVGVIPEPLLGYERSHNADGTKRNDPEELIDQNTYGYTTVVPDMHTRKQLMAAHVAKGGQGSGFVALSGGYGTLEELMEMTTWNQLGIHQLPIVLYSVDDYWSGLVQWVNRAVESGFVSESNKSIIAEGKSAEEVVERLRNYKVSEGVFKLDWTKR